MTYEDYKKQRQDLQKKISDLDAEFLSHSPYQPGDHVICLIGKEEVMCTVQSVRPGYFAGELYRYECNKFKKDGTPGKASAGYGSRILRKV
jgi:hypothetical protein